MIHSSYSPSRLRLGLCSLLLLAAPAFAAPIPVTATFSILGDLVKQVGGEQVAVHSLVGPNGDAHVYQPSPQDVRTLSQSKLLVSNGLHFEGWLDRLSQASGFKGAEVVASQGIKARAMAEEEDGTEEHEHEHDGKEEAGHHHHDGIDPHAWNDPENVIVYVNNIASGLSQLDPEHASQYQANAEAYVRQIKALDGEYRPRFAALSAQQRRAITSHDAFGYLAQAYDLSLLAPQGINTEAEASAADVGKLIRQIRQEHIKALFVENISDPRLIEQIARETGVQPGGSLYSDALSPADGEAPDTLSLLRHNLSTLLKAMEQQ
ncbi:metal ABC transporter substrate-binding protein [Pseudaeromonas sp. ZJS20]|uniref:metal ABC transporter substrate-binding protein n=1 Tax=Pseudaeromonas aegiceratis TaxID=3153928 RepID=UPI00390C8E49